MPDGSVSLRPWSPQPGPQWHAIDAAWCDELLFGGARGGGKSDFLLGDWCADAGNYGMEWRGILFRKTYKQLEELLAQSRRIVPACFPGAVFSKNDWVWTLPNGATLKLRHLDSEVDADEYQGHQYAWIGWDELGNWASDAAYKKLIACLRNGAVPIPNKRIRASANPGGAGHQWVKARFIDHAPKGYVAIYDEETEMRRMFIPSRVGDNKILLANDPKYIKRLHGVGSKELVKAWLEGDWSVVAGAFFDNWSQDKHIIEPIELPAHWTRFRAMDWGSAKPFSVGWYAVSDGELPEFPPGALIRYREWYGMGKEPNTGLKLFAGPVAKGIAERTPPDEKIDYSVCDPAMWISNGGPSIAEQHLNEAGINWLPGDNKRQPGWDQVRGRLEGIDGRPMLYVFSTCVHLIRTLPALQHDPIKAEDLDSDGEDHAADELRYACMSRPWTREATPVHPNQNNPYAIKNLIEASRRRREQED